VPVPDSHQSTRRRQSRWSSPPRRSFYIAGLQHTSTQAIDCGGLTVHRDSPSFGIRLQRRILCGHLRVVNSVQIISTTHRSQLGLV
jgi:hypothetical protein